LKTCLIPDCNGKQQARGYCSKHYARLRRNGSPYEVKLNRERSPTCKIEGCHNEHHAQDYCSMHYMRFKRFGNPLREVEHIKNAYKICEIECCESQVFSKGLCGLHYERKRNQTRYKK
jgi:hypothetical protein